ncbi:MAG: hypothetical protein ACSHYB_06755 [Roseibacillus sp.]
MDTNINTLAKEMKVEVAASLDTLGNRLRKVEKELDLECMNLRDLVNSHDPQLNRQLDALSGSIAELHESLSEVRSHLEAAVVDSNQLEEATQEVTEPASSERKTSTQNELSPKEIGRIRHDEEITLSGIFRALLMADEPAQRANHD